MQQKRSLEDAAGALGWSPAVLEGLLLYRADLRRFNRGQNLTSRRSTESQLDALLLESALVAASLAPSGPCLDIGSGAGLPGIPFAILHPTVPVALLERRGGRCDFLRREVAALGLGSASVLERDATLVPPQEQGLYTMVFLKAVAPPPEALSLASPYLRPRGQAVLYRDAGWQPDETTGGDLRYDGPRPCGAGLGLDPPPVVHIFSKR